MAKPDRNRQVELSIEQENAIELLITGKSDREVAEVCGLSRQTVNDWKNNNARFIAELNRRRAALWESDLDWLRSLVSSSISILAEDLQGENKKARREAAIHILRAVGIYGSKCQPNGPQTESDVLMENWSLFN